MNHPGATTAKLIAERFPGGVDTIYLNQPRITKADLPTIDQLRLKLDEFYAGATVNSYGTRIVPHVWNYRSNGYPGPQVWVAPRLEEIRHTLLFANGIELSDPLPEFLNVMSDRLSGEETLNTWSDPSFTYRLGEACRMWQQVAELVDESVVFMVPWRPARAHPHAIASNLILDAATDWQFRAEYARIISEVDESFSGLLGEWFLSLPSSPAENEAAMEAFSRSEMMDGYLIVPDVVFVEVAHVLHAQTLGRGAAWFPDNQTFQLVQALAASQNVTVDIRGMLRGTWTAREELAALVSIQMPSLARVGFKTLIDLRRSDEAFEIWRGHLRQALEELNRPDAGAAGRRYFEEYLQEAAFELNAALRAQRKSLLMGNLRSIGIAAVGGAVGGLTGGISGTAIGASGGVLSSILETVADNGKRRYTRAIRAAASTAMCIGENSRV